MFNNYYGKYFAEPIPYKLLNNDPFYSLKSTSYDNLLKYCNNQKDRKQVVALAPHPSPHTAYFDALFKDTLNFKTILFANSSQMDQYV